MSVNRGKYFRSQLLSINVVNYVTFKSRSPFAVTKGNPFYYYSVV